MLEDWHLIDALMGGTKTMRRAGIKYLPKWPAEDHKSYEIRKDTATLFPAYHRTVSVLTGKPFSKPVTIGEDVPPTLVEWLENIDLLNNNLHVFAASVCHEAMAYGLCGILVDCPPANGARTVADEKAAGIRPYWLHIHPTNIIGWRSEISAGEQKLTQLRLLESVEVNDGRWATKTIEQVRVLEPGYWAIYRRAEDPVRPDNEDQWVLFAEGPTTLDVIPFVPVYGFRRDFMIGCPPMMELAFSNVEHWQSASDQQNILHVARVPILFANGLGGAPIEVGANSLVRADSENADLKYVEHSGKAIEAGRMSLLDLEDRMRQVGAELLIIKPGNTTEVQTIADNEQGMCDLQRIMQAVEDSLDQALDLTAKWIGEAKGGHVSIYRDFGAATLAESSAALLFEMNSTGKLSNETMLSELKRRGILSPDLDIDEEIVAAKADAPPVEVTENVSP
jgi:hypothetical protein